MEGIVIFQILLAYCEETIQQKVRLLCRKLTSCSICICNSEWEMQRLLTQSDFHCFVICIDQKLLQVQKLLLQLRNSEQYRYCPIVLLSSQAEFLFPIMASCCYVDFLKLPLCAESEKRLETLLQYHHTVFQSSAMHMISCFKADCAKTYFRLPYRSILFLEAAGKKTILHTAKEEFLLPVAFHQVKSALHCSSLIQSHRSYIINILMISSIQKEQLPWIVSFFGTEKTALISRSYRDEIEQHLLLDLRY